MKANPDNQPGQDSSAKGVPVVAIQVAVALVVAIVLIWFWLDQEPANENVDDLAAQSELVRSEPPEIAPAPDVPRRPVDEPVIAAPLEVPEDLQESTPLPPDGDAELRETLSQAGANELLNGFLSEQRPLDVSAALIDGMSWGAVLRKILPAKSPKQAFAVDIQGDQMFMSASSYERYDVYADSVEALDTDSLVAGFHRLRPLYEATYGTLGLDPEDFDNAVIRVLDRVLSTPEIDQPVALARTSVLYKFEDPKLESLPDLQKQLLRMGPENLRRIKAKARALRDKLLES